MKIGIPLSLSAYPYYPLWKTFLEFLGLEVVTSPPTNRFIMDMGVKCCVDDACLPVKIFHGHVQYLTDKADKILVPQIMSVQKKEYSCPFICGLPEMIRCSIPLNTPVIELKVNLYKGEDLSGSMVTFGLHLTDDKRLIKKALRAALEALNNQTRLMLGGVMPDWTADIPMHCDPTGGIIGILGHPYVLYDMFLSSVIFKFLSEAGFTVLVPEMIKEEITAQYASTLPKKMFWSSGKHLYGSAMHMANMRVDGILYLSSFGCGVDSIIADLCERVVHKQGGIPFFLLTLDEHTGEAGIRTRVEAFCDMISRRKAVGRNVSPYGEYLYCAKGVF